MVGMETCVRLRGLTKDYGSGSDTARAVDGIDLDIKTGEIVALLGPNGAGKTTTLDMVLGFTAPTAGEVTIFDQAPRDAVIDGRVSAMLQTGGLLRDLKVGETVELVASTYREPAPVEDTLARVGLDELAGRLVQGLSGGEQQRLRFALALLADPDLLLLDEPTAGMDVEARRAFWATMTKEAEGGRTIVFATHYLQEAEDYAERTVLMANGRIVADGPTDQVRRQASGRTVRARVPVEQIQQVAEVIGLEADTRRVEVTGDLLVVETADSDEVARRLLGQFNGRDLEIEPASLEAAFIRITNSQEPEVDGRSTRTPGPESDKEPGKEEVSS